MSQEQQDDLYRAFPGRALSPEQRQSVRRECEAPWAASPDVREEFGGRFHACVGYVLAMAEGGSTWLDRPSVPPDTREEFSAEACALNAFAIIRLSLAERRRSGN